MGELATVFQAEVSAMLQVATRKELKSEHKKESCTNSDRQVSLNYSEIQNEIRYSRGMQKWTRSCFELNKSILNGSRVTEVLKGTTEPKNSLNTGLRENRC